MDPEALGLELRKLLRLERAANGIVGEARGILDALFDEIVAELARIDPTGPTRRRFREERLRKLMAEVQRLTGSRFTQIRRLLISRLSDLGTIQAEAAAKTLQETVLRGSPQATAATIAARIGGRSVVGRDLFRAILESDPFGEPGKRVDLLSNWIDSSRVSTVDAFRRRIRAGMVAEDTLDDMVRAIRGQGGVRDMTRNQVEAVTRTAVNFISNKGYDNTFQRNADVIAGLQYAAVLDGRTTLICASRDGTVYALDDPNRPQLPAHYGCRSVYVAVVDWEGLGLSSPDQGTRQSDGGQVPAGLSFEAWLRRAPLAKQIQVLGRARAELFRGGMSLSQMVREDGTTITLDQLRAG
jgi:SPP1 gp7 family putative phage head morphogenesis protein